MSKRLRSPIKWFGGKGKMASKLLKLIPPHKYYCEPFGGGASLLFAKSPASVEVYNDLNEHLVNFFKVLRDEEKFEKFKRKVEATPYSRQIYDESFESYTKGDEIDRAYKFYVVARMSFGGRFGAGYGTVVTSSRKNMAATSRRWLSSINQLPKIHARLMRVQIENQDWRTVLERYNDAEYFIYVDPPYVAETRKAGGYKNEMTDKDHLELVTMLMHYSGMVMLSGYDHEIYSPLEENGWDKIEYETSCRAAGRTRHTGIQGEGSAKKKQARTEIVWRNPKCVKKGSGPLFSD